MITLSICLSLIILALLAAVFSQQSSDWVLPNDLDMYFPPFFKSEGFYRAFLINLSFAGISTAASAIQFVTYTSFWTLCDPFLAILMNLGLGLFASMSLKSETKGFTSGERKTWTIWVLVLELSASGLQCLRRRDSMKSAQIHPQTSQLNQLREPSNQMAKKKAKKTDTPRTTAQQLGSLIKSARDIMRKDKGLNGDLDRLPLLTWIMFLKFLDDREKVEETRAQIAGKKYKSAVEPPYRWRDWATEKDGITGDELIAYVNQDEAVRPDGKRGPGLLAYLRSLQSSNGDRRRDVIATVFDGVINRMISGYLMRDVVNLVDGIHFDSSEEIHTLAHLYESMLREMRDAAGDSGEF